MEVLEEVCEICFGIFLFRNRTPVEMLALCCLGGFPRLCTLLDLGQVFLSYQRSPLSPGCSTKPVQLCSLQVPPFSLLLQQERFELELCQSHLLGFHSFLCLSYFLKQNAIMSQFPKSASVAAVALCQESSGFQPRSFTSLFIVCLIFVSSESAALARLASSASFLELRTGEDGQPETKARFVLQGFRDPMNWPDV